MRDGRVQVKCMCLEKTIEVSFRSGLLFISHQCFVSEKISGRGWGIAHTGERLKRSVAEFHFFSSQTSLSACLECLRKQKNFPELFYG